MKNVCYRGFLDTCNYSCEYCAFRKRGKRSGKYKRGIEADREAIRRFSNFVIEREFCSEIMFLPYGEALIHDYYIEEIARLSRRDFIEKISCQTNLSFSAERFAEIIGNSGNISKVKLWCTFHPTQTNKEAFLKNCTTLYEKGIEFCVGAVGVPKNIADILVMREELKFINENIYFWINAMEGMGRAYTEGEIEQLSGADPFFRLELLEYKADSDLCTSGRERIFVDGMGNISACNISRIKLGNIYEGFSEAEEGNGVQGNIAEKINGEFYEGNIEENMKENCVIENCLLGNSLEGNVTENCDVGNCASKRKICAAERCNCYLSYCSRTDIPELFLFGDNEFIRIPQGIKAVFFDIDGTLTDDSGNITQSQKQLVETLSHHCRVFLATSLPYSYAKETCAEIWEFISGGSFAEGSDLRVFGEYKRVVPLDGNIVGNIAGNKAVFYKEDEILHKITFLHRLGNNVISELRKYFSVSEQGNITGITNISATKLSGIIDIMGFLNMEEKSIAVVGNSENDIPMLKYFSNSITVGNAEKCAEIHGKYKLDGFVFSRRK